MTSSKGSTPPAGGCTRIRPQPDTHLCSSPRTLRSGTLTVLVCLLAFLQASPAFADSRLGNLSTRGFVQSGDNVMIGGLVIEGPAPKTVVIRAIGPSLSAHGVANALADPNVQVFSGQTLVRSNDNWADDARAAELPSALVPGHAAEAALVITLEPGPYTAIVRSADASTGIGLIEAFELDETSAFVNISTRGFAGTGDNVLIGGLIIAGDSAKTVVIRGIGPGLTSFGVPDVLQDPNLLLFSGSELIDTNNNWVDHPRSAEIPAQLIPSASLESVIVTTLAPGPYTAILQGFSGGTGNALVEVYEVGTGDPNDPDGDGLSNNIDLDDDGDGFVDLLDSEPLNAALAGDHDGDGTDSVTDTDDDNDGVADVDDAAPLDQSVTSGSGLCIIDQSAFGACNLL